MKKQHKTSGRTAGTLSRRQFSGLMALFMFIILTAFGLIYVKHSARYYYHQIQLQQRLTHLLHIEHNQLLLEESTWGAPARIQAMAQLHFGMQTPGTDALVMVVL